MILPTKHIPEHESLLGFAGLILRGIGQQATVTEAWDHLKRETGAVTFDRFVLALDLLYLMGLVEWESGVLRRRTE